MNYVTVFEMQLSGLGTLEFARRGLILIAIAALSIIWRHDLAKIFGRPRYSYYFPFLYNYLSHYLRPWYRVAPFLYLGFAVLWTVSAWHSASSHQNELRSRYVSGDFTVVEGVVENFDPMPEHGNKMESFTVKNTKFSYSDFYITPGFNNAASRGGPIREGLYVRISHIGNTIVKLEVGTKTL